MVDASISWLCGMQVDWLSGTFVLWVYVRTLGGVFYLYRSRTRIPMIVMSCVSCLRSVYQCGSVLLTVECCRSIVCMHGWMDVGTLRSNDLIVDGVAYVPLDLASSLNFPLRRMGSASICERDGWINGMEAGQSFIAPESTAHYDLSPSIISCLCSVQLSVPVSVPDARHKYDEETITATIRNAVDRGMKCKAGDWRHQQDNETATKSVP
ncbi:hypothetical protein BO70DRAFT_185685 [Aspergillus heteromorphus CBS 117.55]|uniref:Uncharacterized protein n=1 Tax=Aspergillus heteromorphus CBS 117.55 TaxID=1448321 RepID=A0A317UU52_9EURO|nr:uncharacterized protein BO70DRAFT_185685 [Aspergillus heteromorphus CBS 117.55]PWY65583.1 hypothetical protein BO70DRAFT_185685 [Aspergillus heteromorphus CBS 117.55]